MARVFKLVVALLLWSALISPAPVHGEVSPNLDNAVTRFRELNISETTADRVLDAVDKQRLNPGDGADLLDLVTKAARENLPANWLAEKIDEGLVKQVPAQRIKAALSAKIEDFRFARNLIREKYPETAGHPTPQPEDIYALADTLSMGLDREKLIAFWRESPPAPLDHLLIATENLALLSQTGYDPDLTRKVLLAGVEAKAFNQAWRYYPRAVAAARRKGISDREIYKTSISVIAVKGSPRDVLSRLGFTSRSLIDSPAGSTHSPSPEQEQPVEEVVKSPEE
jgi:hypothetical protein